MKIFSKPFVYSNESTKMFWVFSSLKKCRRTLSKISQKNFRSSGNEIDFALHVMTLSYCFCLIHFLSKNYIPTKIYFIGNFFIFVSKAYLSDRILSKMFSPAVCWLWNKQKSLVSATAFSCDKLKIKKTGGKTTIIYEKLQNFIA